jgi:hypothetical protein
MDADKIDLFVEDHDLLDYEEGEEEQPYDPADDHLLDLSDLEEAGPTGQAQEEEKRREPTPGNQAGTSGLASASPRGALKNPKGEPTLIFNSREKKLSRKRIRTTKKRSESKKTRKYRGDQNLKMVQYHSVQEVIHRRRGEEDQDHPSEPMDLMPFPDQQGEWERLNPNAVVSEIICAWSEEEEEEEASWKTGRKVKLLTATSGSVPIADQPAEANPHQEPPPVVRYLDTNYYNPSTNMGLESAKTQWAMADQGHRMCDIRRQPAIKPLDKMTIKEAIRKVREATFSGTRNEDFHDWSQESKSEQELERRRIIGHQFVECVQKSGILSFNTEGHGQPKLMMSLANFDGTVIFWNDLKKIPQEIWDLVEDISVTKVGVGLSNDFRELRERGTFINNWVDLGGARIALYKPALLSKSPYTPEDEVKDEIKAYKEKQKMKKRGHFNPARFAEPPQIVIKQSDGFKCGLSSLVHDLKECGLFHPRYRRTAYHHWWKAEEKFAEGKFPDQMKPHIIENVRVPLAYMILVASHVSWTEKADHKRDSIMPYIHEILDLIRGRDPQHFQTLLDLNIDYWKSRVPNTNRDQVLMTPSSGLEIENARRAFAHRNEEFFSKKELQDNLKIAMKRFTGEEAIELPTTGEAIERKGFRGNTNRCRNCARIGHQRKDCPDVIQDCDYEHDGEEFEPHSVLTCPVLHHYCDYCMSVGHLPSVHFNPNIRKSQLSLRRRYFKNMIRGAWTSMLFLALDPDSARMLSNKHFKYGYDGNNFRRSVITRYALKMTGQEVIGDRTKKDVKNEEEKWIVEELARRKEFKKRIEGKNWSDMTPLSRNFYLEERTRLAKERKDRIVNIKTEIKKRRIRR